MAFSKPGLIWYGLGWDEEVRRQTQVSSGQCEPVAFLD